MPTEIKPLFNEAIVLKKLESLLAPYTDTDNIEYNVSVKATSNSTLPPLLNAFELYVIRPATGITTYSEDGIFYHSCLILCTSLNYPCYDLLSPFYAIKLV